MSQPVNGEVQAASRAARKSLKSKTLSWLQVFICLIINCKSNRSVSVPGQQGVACSPITMLAILDHSLGGMISFFFVVVFLISFFIALFLQIHWLYLFLYLLFFSDTLFRDGKSVQNSTDENFRAKK